MKLRSCLSVLMTVLLCLTLLFGCSSNKDAADLMDSTASVVYVTGSGTKYHRTGCRHLSQSSHPLTLQDALNNHYSPCSVCDPGEPKSEPESEPEQEQESFGAVLASLIKRVIVWNTDSPLTLILSIILDLIVVAIAAYALGCFVIFILSCWLNNRRRTSPPTRSAARPPVSFGDRLENRLLSSRFFIDSIDNATLTVIVLLIALVVFALYCLYVFATS